MVCRTMDPRSFFEGEGDRAPESGPFQILSKERESAEFIKVALSSSASLSSGFSPSSEANENPLNERLVT